MTMHLAHPALSLSGKRKGKAKFRNAAEARKARELDANWENMQRQWQEFKPFSGRSTQSKTSAESIKPLVAQPHIRDTGPRIPSLNGGRDMAPAVKKEAPVYTGTKIIGIGTMHKSNAVPIFSDDDAKAISSMRR
jgi:hypothetical protein